MILLRLLLNRWLRSKENPRKQLYLKIRWIKGQVWQNCIVKCCLSFDCFGRYLPLKNLIWKGANWNCQKNKLRFWKGNIQELVISINKFPSCELIHWFRKHLKGLHTHARSFKNLTKKRNLKSVSVLVFQYHLFMIDIASSKHNYNKQCIAFQPFSWMTTAAQYREQHHVRKRWHLLRKSF